MFGYVVPCQPELKMKEFALYRSVYCSLCETLREFGCGSKLLLNYDFTFAAIFCMSLRMEEPEFYNARCSVNPLVQERLIKSNSSLKMCAAALLVCSQYKLHDDRRDEDVIKKIISSIIAAFLSQPFHRASVALPDFDAVVKLETQRQIEFESSMRDNIDEACDPTSQMLSAFFSAMSNEAETNRILARLGYFIGRYVYLSDALDDLSSDVAGERYNPFAIRFEIDKHSTKEQISAAADEARAQLFHSIGEIESCYRLIQLELFKPLLDNIIYLGLRNRALQLTGFEKSKKGHLLYGQSISGSRS